MKKLKAGTKIGAGFGGAIILALLIGGSAIMAMRSVSANLAEIDSVHVLQIVLASQMSAAAWMIPYHLRGYLLYKDSDYLDAVFASFDQLSNELLPHIKAMLDANPQLSQRRTLYDKISQEVTDWRQMLNQSYESLQLASQPALNREAAYGQAVSATHNFLAAQQKFRDEKLRS